MIVITCLILWFACGAIGARLGERNHRRRFGTSEGLEPVIGLTTALGPVGLAGAWFFVLADQRSEDIITKRRGRK